MLPAPPPWTLYGTGLVLLAHFPEAFVREHGFLAPYQHTAYRGWLGTVILVDYQTSNVGPCRELLFIPGLFRFGSTTAFSISRIYVSTDDSVQNGIANWGIPKERADFDWTAQSDGSYRISVQQHGRSSTFFFSTNPPLGLAISSFDAVLAGLSNSAATHR